MGENSKSNGAITRSTRDDDRVMGNAQMRRIGKKKAGRLLDGIEHNGFPIVKGACA